MINRVEDNRPAWIDETHETDQFPLAEGEAVIDNVPVTSKVTKSLHQPLIRRVEHWFISLGMLVIAYLLERVILRSITPGKPGP